MIVGYQHSVMFYERQPNASRYNDLISFPEPVMPYRFTLYLDTSKVVEPLTCPVGQAGEVHHLMPFGVQKNSHTIADVPITGLPENGSVNLFTSETHKPTLYLTTLYISNGKITELTIPSLQPDSMFFVERTFVDCLLTYGSTFQAWQNAQRTGQAFFVRSYPVSAAPVPFDTHLKAGCAYIEGERICWEERLDVTDSEVAAAVIAGLIAYRSKNATAFHVADTVYLMSRDGRAIGGLISGVSRRPEGIPSGFKVHQNYPNPFNPKTTIRFEIPRTTHVVLTVYNVLGEEVAELVNGIEPPGVHEVVWEPEKLSSGIYFYRVQAGTLVETKKLVLVR